MNRWMKFTIVGVVFVAVTGCGKHGGESITLVDSQSPQREGWFVSVEAAFINSHARGEGTAPKTIAVNAIQPHLVIQRNSVYVTFIKNGNIAVSVSRDGGATFSQPVVAIDVNGRARGGAQRGPRIGVDTRGHLTVTAPITFDDQEYKKRYPTFDLFFTQSKDGGKTWTRPKQINEISKKAPESLHWMTVATTGEAHVAWLDLRDRNGPGQDIFYAQIKNGIVGKNVKVATTVCECCAPGLALDQHGNALLAYREGGKKTSREIFVRRLSGNDGELDKPQQVNRFPTLENG